MPSIPTLHVLWIVSLTGISGGLTTPLSAVDTVEVRGHVRCLEESQVSSDEKTAGPCDEPGARFAFDTTDGRSFELLPDDPKAGAFLDPRIRGRDLALKGWIRPDDQFEILSVFSILDGVSHHVHYRCDVCDITSVAPGPCWCCGADFDLREVPAGSGGDD